MTGVPPADDRRRFRVIRWIGEGGFGRVYLAEMRDDSALQRLVALKVHQDGVMFAEESLRRFRDEARLLGRLHHRALVPVLAFLRLEPGWTIVQEWVDGVDLSTLLDQGALPVRVVLEIVHEIADALAIAWDAPQEDGQPLRIIHRDIKPANIRITVHGDVRLLDLGAARADLPDREGVTTKWRARTPAYFPPERGEGLELPVGDVWSLGLVALDLLRGSSRAGGTVKRSARDALVERVKPVLDEQVVDDPHLQGELLTLLTEMTAWDHEQRPTMADVRRRAADLVERSPGPRPRDWLVAAVRHAQTRRPPPESDDPWVGRVLVPLPADGAVLADGGEAPSGDRRRLGGALVAVTASVLVGWVVSLGWGTTPAAPAPSDPVIPADVAVAPPSPADGPAGSTIAAGEASASLSGSSSTPGVARPPPSRAVPLRERKDAPPPSSPPRTAEAPTLVDVRLRDASNTRLDARPVTKSGGAASVPGRLAPGEYKLYEGDRYRGSVNIVNGAHRTIVCDVGLQRKCRVE